MDDFVGRAAANPKVNFARAGSPVEWKVTDESVAKLKKHLVQLVCAVTGGPQKYEGRDMKASHAGMKITNAEFDALAGDQGAPVFPATSIVRERNSGTLALLLNTPLGAWRIFWGKLLSVMSLAGLMLSLSLPAAAACYALGGISLTHDLLAVYGLLLLAALQFAALGLLVSTYATTTDAAVVGLTDWCCCRACCRSVRTNSFKGPRRTWQTSVNGSAARRHSPP